MERSIAIVSVVCICHCGGHSVLEEPSLRWAPLYRARPQGFDVLPSSPVYAPSLQRHDPRVQPFAAEYRPLPNSVLPAYLPPVAFVAGSHPLASPGLSRVVQNPASNNWFPWLIALIVAVVVVLVVVLCAQYGHRCLGSVRHAGLVGQARLRHDAELARGKAQEVLRRGEIARHQASEAINRDVSGGLRKASICCSPIVIGIIGVTLLILIGFIVLWCLGLIQPIWKPTLVALYAIIATVWLVGMLFLMASRQLLEEGVVDAAQRAKRDAHPFRSPIEVDQSSDAFDSDDELNAAAGTRHGHSTRACC